VNRIFRFLAVRISCHFFPIGHPFSANSNGKEVIDLAPFRSWIENSDARFHLVLPTARIRNALSKIALIFFRT